MRADNWMWAQQEVAEWQELSRKHRQRKKADHRVGIDDEFPTPPETSSPLVQRFRLVHRAKQPIEAFRAYFVHQHALVFGRNAKTPRVRRPAFVLRFEDATGQYIVAPMSPKDSGGSESLYVDTPTAGLTWFPKVFKRNFAVARATELVDVDAFRRNDPDSPIFEATEPLRGTLLAYIYSPEALAQGETHGH